MKETLCCDSRDDMQLAVLCRLLNEKIFIKFAGHLTRGFYISD